MEIRHSRKSMLGSRRSHIGATTYNEKTLKTFEMIPKSLQIAETLRKQRSVSNNDNTFASSVKNLSVRQPRRSMLGTRKLNRDSIVSLPVPDLSLPSQSHDSLTVESDLTGDVTLTSSEPRMSIVSEDAPRIPPSGDNFSQRDGVHHTLPSVVFGKLSESFTTTEKCESPPLRRNVPIREMFPSCSLNLKDSSFIENDTLLVNDESLLATTLNDTAVTNENSFLVSIEKSESPLPDRDEFLHEMLPSCTPDSRDGSFVENETFLANEGSLLAVTLTNNNTTVTNDDSFLASTLTDAPKEDISLAAPTLSDTTIANESSCHESTLKDESKKESSMAISMDCRTVLDKKKISYFASTLKDDLDEEIPTTSFTHTAEPSESDFVSIPLENRFDTENEATVLSDRTVTNKNSQFSTSLKDVTNTRIEVPQKNCNLVKETAMKSEESKKYDDNLLRKMLDLLNTWMLRSTETIDTYQKEIADLQKKVDQAKGEIEDMKNLKETLIKKFSDGNNEKENLNVEPNSTAVEDNMTKTYIKEMRSTLKFMKTPLTSRTRMPRSSMMLTPHSMSFSLQNQYEQLFD